MIQKLRDALNRHILAYRPVAETAAVKCGCSACKVCIEQWEADIELVRKASEEVNDARALREVLLKLAPHVAVQSRNPLVAPANRLDLLGIEPVMLKVLLDTKYLGDP